MNRKDKEMREEARERIIECLKNYYDGYYSDLHHEVFNTDCYIIGTHRAKEVLEEYGVFNAIKKVQTYEKENFGEVYTDLSDPEKLADMLFYIIGEEVFWDIFSESETLKFVYFEGTKADEETNIKILKELEEKAPCGYC